MLLNEERNSYLSMCFASMFELKLKIQLYCIAIAIAISYINYFFLRRDNIYFWHCQI